MRSRFTPPDIKSVPMTDLPESFRNPKIPASAPEPSPDGGLLHVFSCPAVLHVVTNEDEGTESSEWKVEAYLHAKELTTSAAKATSVTDVRDMDTPETVGDEFARDLVHALSNLISELGGESSVYS